MRRISSLLIFMTLTLFACYGFDRQKHTVDDVIETFSDANLVLADMDVNVRPQTNVASFLIHEPQSDDTPLAMIFVCESSQLAERLRSEFIETQQKSKLPPDQVYVKDNLVLSLSPDVPDGLAQKYLKVFESIGD
jgi:hypothetical protein